MASGEDTPSDYAKDDGESTSPRAELLSSKFLRKTKFRRKSFPAPAQLEATSGEPIQDEAVDLDERKSLPQPQEERKPSTLPLTADMDTSSSLPDSEFGSGGANTSSSETGLQGEPIETILPLSFSTPREPSLPRSCVTSPPMTDISMPPSPRATSPDKTPPKASSSVLNIPCFPLSPEELDQAKSLVLDLLGWGVPPEYLVESGISPESLFRIFTDLNLHLPENLELSEESKAIAYSWGPLPAQLAPEEPQYMNVFD